MKKIIIVLSALFLMLGMIAGVQAQEMEKETVVIAVTAGSPPFSFVDAETGEEVGFDVDYAKEVAERIGMEPEILMVEWAGILPGLLAGKYDMIIGSMAITEERQEQANFSLPYYVSGAQLIVRADDDSIMSLEDLAGKKVGVTLGTTYEEKANEIEGVEVMIYKTEMDQLLDLVNGNIDAVITDKYIGAYTIQESGLDLKLVGELIYEETMGIPVRMEDTDLLEKLNAAVEEITNDGTLDELGSTWFGI